MLTPEQWRRRVKARERMALIGKITRQPPGVSLNARDAQRTNEIAQAGFAANALLDWTNHVEHDAFARQVDEGEGGKDAEKSEHDERNRKAIFLQSVLQCVQQAAPVAHCDSSDSESSADDGEVEHDAGVEDEPQLQLVQELGGIGHSVPRPPVHTPNLLSRINSALNTYRQRRMLPDPTPQQYKKKKKKW